MKKNSLSVIIIIPGAYYTINPNFRTWSDGKIGLSGRAAVTLLMA
jgi:hypothetical protein